MKKHLGIAGIAALALTVLLTAPAQAAVSSTIYVPDDFDPTLSDTRTTGDYRVEGTALRLSTTGTASTDKVAEYVRTDVALTGLDEPSLVWRDNPATAAGGEPGYQVVVDFDGDGRTDGILVGESVYGDAWWLAGSNAVGQSKAPQTGGGYGSPYYGTWAEWTAQGGTALAFGFSLGSGVYGDGWIDSITFDGVRYTFAAGPKPVVLTSKEQCKNGGWQNSTTPVFKNQGACVSSFASGKK